ncbi:lamina-associated polypeptide 2, isoforms beta/delta/epsilon/gamma isoform X8 [Oncorhynchus mykiss]|uniref:lamina-associated polypeptide 2, isoforms beta/delta/epsilon/gamma isoform X8 n=1 Tax=Oncorhynchus mykiss TaxID=8022 RepID=UPI001877EF8D|nr:lamina-associated polypeptide 2, isoforms beta/delta/epsilon/gamma isoform X8 [Oncorhynchus mykiss]
MPEYLEDPSVLTKDKLKSELLANNVALPTGDQRKDVYVRLYLKNLTVQNNKILSTDAFSSDEELLVPVVSNKSRSGRKATRKTDKPRPEDLDVTELTSEGLKDELLKYGINVGPIVASTRKLYERRLQKLLDQGPPETVALPVVITQVDSNHNGNSDSDRYSDKEEEVTTEPEPVPVPVVERPVRSRGKTPVTTRTRSSQHNRIYAPEEDDDDDLEEEHPVLNIKRPLRRSSHRVDQMVPASDDIDVSELSAGEGVLHPPREAKTKAPLLLEVLKEPKPILAEKPSSTPLLHGLAHAQSTRTIHQVVLTARAESPSPRLTQDPAPSIHAPVGQSIRPLKQLPLDQRKSKNDLEPKWKQQKNTPFLSSVTPVRGQDSVSSSISKEPWVEKIAAGEQTPNRVDEKDILKEMFPYETNTPTGINATCRRPIRGAAGRPLKSGDLWTDETLLRSSHSSYTESRTATVHRVPTLPPSTRLLTSVAPPAGKAIAPPHGLPVWLKLLLLGIVAGFIFFIYQTMETNAMAPFGGSSDSTQTSGREVRK